MSIEKIIKSENVTIVDVRTPAEFIGGNVEGSLNIPLRELPRRMEEIKQMSQPIVLCCASGARSGQAHMMLQQNGISDCYNGGSWMDVQYLKFN